MSENLRDIYESALEEADARPDSALAALRGIVLGDHPNDTDHVKLKEQALEKIVVIHVKQRNSGALKALLAELRPLFAVLPKAKTAKLVRTIVDALAKIPDSTPVQLQVCTEMVEWARSEKRTFLRQHLQVRLATLRFETQDYTTALDLIGVLLSEIKRLDDKLLLVHIHLLESRVHHALRNLPRSKAALTAAKTAANSIYIPPGLQAEIDLRSGILNAEEKDYKTAYSYFFEAFEQFNNLDDPKAVGCMKYMLLCKIMTSDADHVPGIISSKAGLKYTGPEVDAMKAVAKAYQARSLADFQSALNTFKPQLQDDPIVSSHLRALYDSLLEQNLSRLIEPFSRVEVAHIAELISLPVQQVEARLSQMILDKKMLGTLDQGSGSLEIFEPEEEDKIYPGALEIISNMGRVVDTLFARSQKLVA